MSTRFVMTPTWFGGTRNAVGPGDIAGLFARAHAIHVSRRELADLDQRLLEDIGITPRQALTEAGRAPWDIRPARPQRRGGRNDRGLDSWVAALRTGLRMSLRRWRSRQRISQLDQHALRDIGITYAEAEREANKPFWQR